MCNKWNTFSQFFASRLFQVVVANQITTRFIGAGSSSGNEGFQDVDGADVEPEEDDGSHVTAALGNTWSHAVNTRLIVQYLDERFRQVLTFKIGDLSILS